MRVRLIVPVIFQIVLLMIYTTYGARFALLVGNSKGGSDVSRLRYIKNDLMSLSVRPSNLFDDVPFGYKLDGIELSMYVLFTLRLREVKE